MENKWQPIESIPSKGLFIILIYHGNYGVRLVRSYLDGDRVFEEFTNNGCRPTEFLKPTHWMPLPLPPEKN